MNDMGVPRYAGRAGVPSGLGQSSLSQPKALIPNARWTPDEIRLAIEMKAQGFTHRQIGNEIGRSKHSVAALIARQTLGTRSLGRQCGDCGTVITDRSKTGRCSPCNNKRVGKDPAFQARRMEGIRRKFEDPAHLKKMQAIARRNGQKAAAEPGVRERLVERGKELYRDYLSRPDIRAKCIEAIRANSHKISDAALGWCPQEMRARYRHLTATKRMRAADARAQVEAEWADWQAHRDLDDAMRWLNRIAPCRKLDTGFIQYGSAELRPAEVINRAKLKGWERLAA